MTRSNASMTITPMSFILALSWLLISLPFVCSEIRDFRVILEPDSTVVHYSEGFLVAPGYINLSDLKFTTTAEGSYPDDFDFDDTDDNEDPSTLDDTLVGEDDAAKEGGDDLPSEGGEEPPRRLASPDLTMLDIAVLHLPGSCANTQSGCDWPDFGIGSKNNDGDVRWCCSQDAVELGLCEGGDKYGRLIVNNTLFLGTHRYVEIPPTGQISDQIRYGKIEIPDKSGRYVVIFANCNDEGREVLVTGATVWKSKHGYLPGELYEFMYFYMAVTLIYFVLMAAYGWSMHIYAESRIDLEKWIFGTIIMGLLETFFRTGSFVVWNEDGTNLMIAVYIGKSETPLSCMRFHPTVRKYKLRLLPMSHTRCLYGGPQVWHISMSHRDG
jgi:Lung seven transmembrane receptor